jgi:hypothetical protein
MDPPRSAHHAGKPVALSGGGLWLEQFPWLSGAFSKIHNHETSPPGIEYAADAAIPAVIYRRKDYRSKDRVVMTIEISTAPIILRMRLCFFKYLRGFSVFFP